MKILVTGGTGLVGSAILRNPLLSNHLLISPTSKELDLRDFKQTLLFLTETKPDFIIHCAGLVGGILVNNKYPTDFFLVNLEIGINIIRAAMASNIQKILNLSSSCVYPKNHSDSLHENMILTGTLESTNEGYALAKLAAMKLCEFASRENTHFEYKSLIPCNLYGQNDKFEKEKSHLIPAIIKKIHFAIKNNESNVIIWGDGKAKREFMYVDDLADFIGFAVNNFSAIPQVMNVGVGKDYSILDYYKIAAKVLGYKGSFSFDTSKPSGMARKLLDVSKQSHLGWTPKISIEEGIDLTYKCFLKTIWSQNVD